MRKTVCLLGIVTLSAAICGCNTKEPDKQKQESGSVTRTDDAGERNLTLKYLQGIQNGDKKAMYEAANLTEAIVNESREKIVYQSRYNLSNRQRKDFEKSLQISGEIDHTLHKLRKNFPKSADLKASETLSRTTSPDGNCTDIEMLTTYNNRDEAIRDKTGRPVKEMGLKVRNCAIESNGRLVHEFAFNIDDIRVISYF